MFQLSVLKEFTRTVVSWWLTLKSRASLWLALKRVVADEEKICNDVTNTTESATQEYCCSYWGRKAKWSWCSTQTSSRNLMASSYGQFIWWDRAPVVNSAEDTADPAADIGVVLNGSFCFGGALYWLPRSRRRCCYSYCYCYFCLTARAISYPQNKVDYFSFHFL